MNSSYFSEYWSKFQSFSQTQKSYSFRPYSIIFPITKVNGSLNQWVEFRISQINQSFQVFWELNQPIHWKDLTEWFIHRWTVWLMNFSYFLLSIWISICQTIWLQILFNNIFHDQSEIRSVKSISLIHEQITQIGFLKWINWLIEKIRQNDSFRDGQCG